MLVRLRAAVVLTAFAALFVPPPVPAQDTSGGTPSFAEPSISPDRSEIAFVSGGDIWSVAAAGGTARLLAATDGWASRPLFSPDSTRLAFVSTRPGAGGVYIVALAGGALRRLTHDDGVPTLDGWSPDGKYVLFQTSVNNIAYMNEIMRVPADGGTAVRALGERYVNAMDAAESPDGGALAYVRNGYLQWWRRGRSHMDQSEITIARLAAGGRTAYDTVTNGDAKDRWPMWAPDGRTVYFVSDRSGHDEIWASSSGRLHRITSINGEPVLWPTISRDGSTIAFEHEMAIWTCDTANGAVRRVPIVLRGLPDVTPAQHLTLTTRFTALDLAPDARKVAFVARGRIFAANAQEAGEATEVMPHAAAAFNEPVWARGSREIVFTVDRGLDQSIATFTFPDGPERVLTPAGNHDASPIWSPDGRRIAYVRDQRELHLLDPVSRADRIVAHARFAYGVDMAFSPAGDWLAYRDTSSTGLSNVWVVPTAGGAPRQITFLPNAFGGSIAWAPDGSRLFFVSAQRTELGQIAQIDLVPRTPRFREDAFRRLFTQEPPAPLELPPQTPASPMPSTSPRPVVSPSPTASTRPRTVTIDFGGIRDRLTLLPVGLDVQELTITPDSRTLVLAAEAANQDNLYTFSVDESAAEPAVAHQITTTPGRKSNLSLTPDGKSIYFLDAGRVATATLDGRTVRTIAIGAPVDVDFARDKPLVFRQAWSAMERFYADPGFHGADWNAVRRTFEPYALGARTPAEFRRSILLMIGQLNSSHQGYSLPPTPGLPRFTTGRLAAQWDPATYERSGRLRVAEVTPLGPLALAHVAPGDEVLAVDGVALDRRTDIDALLANTIGKRTTVRIAPHGDANAARTVVVQPVDLPTQQGLLYRAWTEGRRAYVERISGGRLGYVHLFDMGEESLARLFTDLDVQNRARAGVVIDVRNNEGGFVDPYALDVLTRREYLRFVERNGIDAPERTELGQRALDRPTVLVTNSHSLSDAENFTEGYRALHAGPVVGEPTAGWIIFTGARTLADGSTLRMPSTRVVTPNGVDLELHPRPVDVRVSNPPGAQERGDDPQLDAAVRELLKRVRR